MGAGMSGQPLFEKVAKIRTEATESPGIPEVQPQQHQALITQTPSRHWEQRPEAGDRDLENFRNNGLSAGLDGLSHVSDNEPKPWSSLYLNGAHVAHNLVQLEQLVPRWFTKKVMVVGRGNPPTEVTDDGIHVTQSDLTCLWNAFRLWLFCRPQPRRIAEIGGGFGCLAGMLKRLWPYAEYHCIDLEQSLVLQRYYLEEFNNIHYHHDFPDDLEVDLVINIRSMMEMEMEQVNHYFTHIRRQRPGTMFYCVNAKKKVTDIRLYPFGDKWKCHFEVDLLGQEHIREILAERI